MDDMQNMSIITFDSLIMKQNKIDWKVSDGDRDEYIPLFDWLTYSGNSLVFILPRYTEELF